MKVYLQEFGKGAAKALGGVAAVALLGWFVKLALWDRLVRIPLAPERVSLMRSWLMGFAAVALVVVGVVLHFRTRRKLRSVELALAHARQVREGEQQENYQRVYQAQVGRPVGRPGYNEFELLKGFNTLGPQSTAGVREVAQLCNISEAQAREYLQRLHEGEFIYTVIQAPGQWNGKYAITRGGRECVERYGN